MYLAKQFVSLLSLIAVIYFLFLKETRKFAAFGFFGLILKELSFITVFKNLTKNYHLKQIDLIDTFFDLILFRDLKISNIQTILRNLFLDKPSFLIFVIFFILLVEIKGFNGFVSSRIPTKGTTLVPTIGTTKNWKFYKVLKISML